jgi:HlyD family secretion protein
VPNSALRFRPAEESSGQGGPPGAPTRNPAAGASRAGGGAGMTDSIAQIAATLKLDARQQALFDAAMAKMRRAQRAMRAMAQQGSAGQAEPAPASRARAAGARFGGAARARAAVDEVARAAAPGAWASA